MILVPCFSRSSESFQTYKDDIPPSSTWIEVEGLQPYTSYVFKMAASNDAGLEFSVRLSEQPLWRRVSVDFNKRIFMLRLVIHILRMVRCLERLDLPLGLFCWWPSKKKIFVTYLGIALLAPVECWCIQSNLWWPPYPSDLDYQCWIVGPYA